MRIAVYAISKNEEQFVERFCNSAKDADLVMIADTGSTDDTVGLARDHGAIVNHICITPWRFDKARDAALALIPKEYEVCISLDLDEILEPGWREEIERVWVPGKTTRLNYLYDWGAGVKFITNKIHGRKGYHWKPPCHEMLALDPRVKEVMAHTDKQLITHLPDNTKSRGQYMELLEVGVKEDPHCPRNSFYYARELTFYERHDEAIAELKRYLALPLALWNHERAYAMRLIGQSMFGKGEDGTPWYRKAVIEAPEVREPWVELANACYKTSRWEECYSAACSALKITERQYNYTSKPESWGSLPHDLAAIAAYRMGWKDRAIEHGTKALEIDPNDERLKKNLEYYKE